LSVLRAFLELEFVTTINVSGKGAVDDNEGEGKPLVPSTSRILDLNFEDSDVGPKALADNLVLMPGVVFESGD